MLPRSPSPFPDQPRPLHRSQPPSTDCPRPSDTISPPRGCVAGTCPSAWPGLGGVSLPGFPTSRGRGLPARTIPHPTSGPPWSALHPRGCHPTTVSYSTVSYSAAYTLQDSLEAAKSESRPLVTWARSQLRPAVRLLVGVLLHGGADSSPGNPALPEALEGALLPLPTILGTCRDVRPQAFELQSPVCDLLSSPPLLGPLGAPGPCASSWQSRPRAGGWEQ